MPFKPKAKKGSKKLLTAANAQAIQKAMSDSVCDDAAEEERRDLARAITVAKYGAGPDKPIGQSLDEPGERQEMSDWLNYTIAPWVNDVSTYWAWSYCDPSELASLELKSHFAYLCYGHLHPKFPIAQLVGAQHV